ncbi:hypothetical protein Ancab_006630 [Ancistrocladus abbreviatus]
MHHLTGLFFNYYWISYQFSFIDQLNTGSAWLLRSVELVAHSSTIRVVQQFEKCDMYRMHRSRAQMDISNQQKSPHVGHSGDSDENSTQFVRRIQNACRYFIVRKAAEYEWQEKESQLQLQIKELYHEKVCALEDCKSVEAEKSKILKTVLQLDEKLMQKPMKVDEGMELHGKLVQLLELKDSVAVSEEKQQKEHEQRMDILLAKL